MQKRFDVVGFGAMNLDRLYRVERIAREGEHVPIKSVTDAAGGSAANTTSGLACLGAKTGFLGAVGSDPEGRFLLEEFRNEGVDTGGLSVLNERTGIIIGFVDDEGERTLYPYPGANSLLSEKDVDTEYLESARMVHITSFVGDRQFRLQKKLACRLKGTMISFSPGDLYVNKGLDMLTPFIRRSEVVFLNESEAKQLTGESYTQAASSLLDKGAKTVAVTLGKRGCFVADRESSFHIPSGAVKAVDTTGAGDAYAAGFLYGMIRGSSLPETGRCANKTAASCIKRMGARTWIGGRKK